VNVDASQAAADARAALATARTVVVKVGSNVLTREGPQGVELNRARVYDLAADLTAARLALPGRRVVLVSSGAVAAGLEALRQATRPSQLALLQAAAAVGQPRLMAVWHEAFAVRGVAVAQLLLTRTGFDKRHRYLNIRNCLAELLSHDVLPITNENDTVATEEITLGDNDYLAAKLAVLARADALVLLSSVPGVRDEAGRVLGELASADEVRALVRDGGLRSTLGTGGMGSKADAAAIAGAAGAATVVAAGGEDGVVSRLLAGEPLGTLIAPIAGADPETARKRWLKLSVKPSGAIRVDAGAAAALRGAGASLLAKGCTAVVGAFAAGDSVRIEDHDGATLATGLSNFSSDELQRTLGAHSVDIPNILGRPAHAEVVHRDDMVLH